mmetsp:Transcript_5706/g.11089  ORF Transcript_5706/g.11089 Transcript_5706/m.11089 type:complete len:318 (+) Transcript_5706:117-1070(+)
MIRSIKRTFSGNNLSRPRVRFAGLENSRSYEDLSNMEGEAGEGSTMGGDTISSASSSDSMSVPNEGTPAVCTKGDGVDFEGVAIESIRAIGLSAWLVTETLMAVGTEIVRMQGSCGTDNSMETSQTNCRFVDADQIRTPRRALSRLTGKGRVIDSGADDDSSIISYPPSKKKKRRKGRFAFLGGLSNRAKKNFRAGLPSTVVTTDGTSEFPTVALQKKVPPKKPAPPKVQEKAPLKDPPKAKASDPPRWQGGSKDHSPGRAKKLMTGCFVKKHLEDDMTEQTSRYRTDHEDLELMGEQAVYTIRLSRVQSSEYEDLL